MLGEPTIIVKFGDDIDLTEQTFVAELDDDMNLDLAGDVKTSFEPGDPIYFRMHYDSTKIKINRIATTDGEVTIQNQVTRQHFMDQLFEDDTPVELSHVPISVSISWYGKTSDFTRETNEIAVLSWPVFGKITYNFRCTLCRWRTPTPILGEDEYWPIAVVIYVEAMEES